MSDVAQSPASTAALAPRRAGRPPRAAEEGRTAILRGALEVFAEAGFRGASIAAIAKKAGVARPLVLYHFKSKEELWRRAVGQAYDAMRDDLLGAQQDLASLPPRGVVQAFARRAVFFAARHPALVRLVVEEIGKPGPRATWLIETHVAPLYDMARQLVGALNALPDSPLRPVAAEHFLPILLGAMNFIFLDAPVMRRVFAINVMDDAVIERHANFLADLFMDGLLKRSPYPNPAKD